MRDRDKAFDLDWLPPDFSTSGLISVATEMQWTAEMVRHRLVEAARTAEAIVARPGPSRRCTAWPEIERDWADMMNHKTEDRVTPRYISQASIERMEEALPWPRRYVRDQRQRIVLAEFLRARALRYPFTDAIKRRRWSKAGAYRTRDRALATIAMSLMRDKIAP